MGLKKNNPGCGCCGCGCTDQCRQQDGSGNQIFIDIDVCEVDWVIAGMPTEVTYWVQADTTNSLYGTWYKITLSDLDQLNGTYSLDKDASCAMGQTVDFQMPYVLETYSLEDDGTTPSPCVFVSSSSGTATIQLLFGDDTNRTSHQYYWLLSLDDSDIGYTVTPNKDVRYLDFLGYETYPADCYSRSYALVRSDPLDTYPEDPFFDYFTCDSTPETAYGTVDVTISG